jgi:hypothetical protein
MRGEARGYENPPRCSRFSRISKQALRLFSDGTTQCGVCLVAAPRHGLSQRLCSNSGPQAGRLAVSCVPSTVRRLVPHALRIAVPTNQM